MLLRIQKYFTGIKPVTIDGALYVLLAIFGFMQVFITQDDAYKYWNIYMLYYTKFLTGMLLAAVTALKGFRSTEYGKHLADKKDLQTVSSSKKIETDDKGIKTEKLKE